MPAGPNLREVQQRWRRGDRHLAQNLGTGVQSEARTGVSAWQYLAHDIDPMVAVLVHSVLEAQPRDLREWLVSELEGARPEMWNRAAEGEDTHEKLAAATNALLLPLVEQLAKERPTDPKAALVEKLKAT